MKTFVVHHGAVIAARRREVTILAADGSARRFTDESAELVRAALAFFAEPHTEAELGDHLRELAGEECDPSLIAETIACLREVGALGAPHAAAPAAKPGPARGRVLVGVSGAIAATDAPALVRMLLARRFEVTVAMTAAARRFVSADSLEAITHRPVYRRFWQKHQDGPAPHIHLATWADLIVVYPASARTIARIAHGTFDDVLSAAVTASTRPVLIVPSMNEAMLRSAPVTRNLELLREDGRYVVGPGVGHEVAWEPSARSPMTGAAPPPSKIAALVEVLMPAARPKAPAAEGWNAQYETRAVSELPWFTETLDRDLAEELTSHEPKGKLLDVGTGPGTAAIFAAEHGFDVVATDVSPAAIAAARARANGAKVTWVVDDVTDSRVWGPFDVVVDRGCLHCLPRAAWNKYAAAVARWVAPGGRMLLKVHAPEEAGRHGTNPPSAREIEELFGEAFTVIGVKASGFDGTAEPAPKAVLTVMKRNAP